MARKREDNLRPCEYKFTQEDHKKGAVASAKARREKRTMCELAEIVNSLPLSEKNKFALTSKGIDEAKADYQMAFIMSIYNKAVKGDTKAMKLWLEISNPFNEEKSKLEIDKLKAEINKLNVEASSSIEDLSGLADMLKMKNEDTDD